MTAAAAVTYHELTRVFTKYTDGVRSRISVPNKKLRALPARTARCHDRPGLGHLTTCRCTAQGPRSVDPKHAHVSRTILNLHENGIRRSADDFRDTVRYAGRTPPEDDVSTATDVHGPTRCVPRLR
jgi:hypothetical protein